MQPTMCSRCKKNVAVVFISRLENGKTINEGLCLKCAREIGLPQVNELMNRMGITDEDLDNLTSEMMQAFGGAENMEGLMAAGNEAASEDDEDEEGKTATFPFLNRLFSGDKSPAPAPGGPTAVLRGAELDHRQAAPGPAGPAGGVPRGLFPHAPPAAAPGGGAGGGEAPGPGPGQGAADPAGL